MFCATESFFRRKPGNTWGSVVDGDGMTKGVRPQVFMDNIGPVDHSMYQHSAGPFGDGMDIAFCYTVLVMCVYATEASALTAN